MGGSRRVAAAARRREGCYSRGGNPVLDVVPIPAATNEMGFFRRAFEDDKPWTPYAPDAALVAD